MTRLSLSLCAAAVALGAAPSARAGVRCHTPRILLEERGEIPHSGAPRGAAFRPTSVGSVDSAIYPLRVHWRRDSDADRGPAILEDAEHAWRVQVEEMGWPQPPGDETLGGDDRIDFYLTNEQTYGGAYTWGTGGDADPSDDLFSLPAYVALDESLTASDMPVYVAHEFNHVLQYGIDGWEYRVFVWESTAQGMEDVVVDEKDYYYYDIADFNSLPFASILHDSYQDAVADHAPYSYYEYGGCIFSHFLEQRYGQWDGTTLRDLWLALADAHPTDEPDFLDAAEALFAPEGDFGDVYLEFTSWRMFVSSRDDGAHFEEGGLWPDRARVFLEGEPTLDEAVASPMTPSEPPYDLGASYWEIAPGSGATGTLRLAATGEQGARWGVVAAALLGDGPARLASARGLSGEAVAVEVDLEGAERVLVGVANLGPGGLDAEDEPERRGFELVAELRAPDPAGDDDSASGEDEPTSGCQGCDSAGGPGRIPAAALLILAASRRRRSRAAIT